MSKLFKAIASSIPAFLQGAEVLVDLLSTNGVISADVAALASQLVTVAHSVNTSLKVPSSAADLPVFQAQVSATISALQAQQSSATSAALLLSGATKRDTLDEVINSAKNTYADTNVANMIFTLENSVSNLSMQLQKIARTSSNSAFMIVGGREPYEELVERGKMLHEFVKNMNLGSTVGESDFKANTAATWIYDSYNNSGVEMVNATNTQMGTTAGDVSSQVIKASCAVSDVSSYAVDIDDLFVFTADEVPKDGIYDWAYNLDLDIKMDHAAGLDAGGIISVIGMVGSEVVLRHDIDTTAIAHSRLYHCRIPLSAGVGTLKLIVTAVAPFTMDTLTITHSGGDQIGTMAAYACSYSDVDLMVDGVERTLAMDDTWWGLLGHVNRRANIDPVFSVEHFWGARVAGLGAKADDFVERYVDYVSTHSGGTLSVNTAYDDIKPGLTLTSLLNPVDWLYTDGPFAGLSVNSKKAILRYIKVDLGNILSSLEYDDEFRTVLLSEL
jgi:hypothetical protein